MKFLWTVAVVLLLAASLSAAEKPFPKADGYQGIWFTLGRRRRRATSTPAGWAPTDQPRPMAIYAPKVNKTFFVYGGTIPGQRHLLAMIGYYDHATGTVPRPMIVHDKTASTIRTTTRACASTPRGTSGSSSRAAQRPAGLHLPQHEALRHRRLRADREARPHDLPAAVVHRGPGVPVPVHDVHARAARCTGSPAPTAASGATPQKLVGFGGHYQTSAPPRPAGRHRVQLPPRRQRRQAHQPVSAEARTTWARPGPTPPARGAGCRWPRWRTRRWSTTTRPRRSWSTSTMSTFDADGRAGDSVPRSATAIDPGRRILRGLWHMARWRPDREEVGDQSGHLLDPQLRRRRALHRAGRHVADHRPHRTRPAALGHGRRDGHVDQRRRGQDVEEASSS